MINKVFLDTNILLDILIQERAHHKESTDFVKKLIQQKYKLVVDALSFGTIFYIGAERHKKWQETYELLKHITSRPKIWEVYYSTINDDLQILGQMKQGDDYEDLHQYNAALRSGCELILTNDKNFPSLGIKIQNTAC